MIASTCSSTAAASGRRCARLRSRVGRSRRARRLGDASIWLSRREVAPALTRIRTARPLRLRSSATAWRAIAAFRPRAGSGSRPFTFDTDNGAGFWTNRSNHPRAKARLGSGVPGDAFFAFGNLGQPNRRRAGRPDKGYNAASAASRTSARESSQAACQKLPASVNYVTCLDRSLELFYQAWRRICLLERR